MSAHEESWSRQVEADAQSTGTDGCCSEASDGGKKDKNGGDKNGGKRYACEYCPKRFNLQRTYQRHVVEKHRLKVYRCRICQAEFGNRQFLKQHCEQEHQEERVPCHLCNKTFTTKSSLRLHHDAIHKGIRYKCDFCDKSFGQLGSLRRHVNTIHEGAALPQRPSKVDRSAARGGSPEPVLRKVNKAAAKRFVEPRLTENNNSFVGNKRAGGDVLADFGTSGSKRLKLAAPSGDAEPWALRLDDDAVREGRSALPLAPHNMPASPAFGRGPTSASERAAVAILVSMKA